MNAEQAMMRMISISGHNRHDIAHFVKVYAYAGMIGRAEGLDEQTQNTLELCAIVHDIACPLCRQKYGNTAGHHQEAESEVLLREFFAGTDVQGEQLERIIRTVCRHHTYTGVTDIVHRILLEADYLVNADEHGDDTDKIRKAGNAFFATRYGSELLKQIYGTDSVD